MPEAEEPLTVRVLCAPKEGNTDDQYEDACAFTPAESGTDGILTVALADGASSAIFARQWAGLLTEAFGTGEPFPTENSEFAAKVAELGRKWRGEVEGKATTWHAQEKLASGSSSTLLVVTWYRDEMRWEARSIGDVCLFVVRQERLKFAFPVTRSAKFGDRPELLSTEEKKAAPKVVRFGAAYESGDRFLLMTDALSAWFLGQWERKRKPWNDLPTTEEALGPWLKKHRDSGELKNDDVTIVDIIL